MFQNIGKIIKGIAIALLIIGTIGSLILGFSLVNEGINIPVDRPFWLGPLIATIGILTSFLISVFIYGFGQLIENSDIIVNTLAPNYRDVEGKKLEQITKHEMEKINNQFSDDWGIAIKSLSNEELIERINSEEWQFEYRALCKKELHSRGM